MSILGETGAHTEVAEGAEEARGAGTAGLIGCTPSGLTWMAVPADSHPSLTIRMAGEQDVPALVAIKTEAVEAAYGPVIPAPLLDRWRDSHCVNEYFLVRMHRASPVLYFILDGAGMGALGPDSGGVSEVGNLYMRRRHQGFGTAMLQHLENVARALNRRTLVAQVYDWNLPSRQLMARCGFREIHRHPTSELGPPRVVFTKELKALNGEDGGNGGAQVRPVES